MKYLLYLLYLLVLINLTSCNIEIRQGISIPVKYITSSDIKELEENWYYVLDDNLRKKTATCEANKQVYNKVIPVCHEVYQTYKEKCFSLEKDPLNCRTAINCLALRNLSVHYMANQEMAMRAQRKLNTMENKFRNLIRNDEIPINIKCLGDIKPRKYVVEHVVKTPN